MTVEELQRQVPKSIGRWAKHILASAIAYDLDPFVLAAIMSRETLGGEGRGYIPRGDAAGTGDAGHGRGLMQIDDRSHESFLGATGVDGKPLWRDPAMQLHYAASKLRWNLRVFGQLDAAIASYNASVQKVRLALQGVDPMFTPAQRIKALDKATTGQDYVSDVLRRRDEFLTGGYCAAPPGA